VYVDGPDGKRLCTRHEQEFLPPARCPKCTAADAPALKRSRPIASEIDQAITEEVVMLEGIAEEAAQMAADCASETAKVGALRVRLSASKMASDLRMQRANAQHLERLAARKPAAHAKGNDPRDTFGKLDDDLGTAAPDEMFIAGDN
jgi:hypothetical protein